MKEGNVMKVISFAAIKGGVGKTTMSFNFGEYLAFKGKKVLLIDLDHQCNLSQTYDIYESESTVANIFSGEGEVNILHTTTQNIDIIPGDMRLDNAEKAVENQTNKNMLLFMWMNDNYEEKGLDKYDYVIIDCHPDFSTATKNAIAVSHAVLSPVTPSEHGYNAKFNLSTRMEEYAKEAIDFATRKSYITAELLFFANMIKHNTKSSRDLLESLKDESDVIGIVPERELFNKTTLFHESLSKMSMDENTYKKYRKFFDEVFGVFNQMQEKIDSL